MTQSNESFWLTKYIKDEQIREVDRMFNEEYKHLFPIIPDNLPVVQENEIYDPTFEKWDQFAEMMESEGLTEEFIDYVRERYMEYWNEVGDIPDANIIEEKITEIYEELMMDVIEKEYKDDARYHQDKEYKAYVENMYFQAFWDGPGLLIGYKVRAVLNAFNWAYVEDDEIIEEEDGVKRIMPVKEKIFNPAQLKFFDFTFSDVRRK